MERRRSSIPAGTHARSRWNVLHCGRAKMLRLGPFSGLSILPKKRTTSLDLRSNPQRNRRTLAAMATTLKLSATTASVSSLLQTSKRSTSASGKWNSSSTLTLKRESVKFQRLVVRAGEGVEVDVKEAGQKGDILPSGEWAENFSLLNYEDLSKHYEPMLFKPEAHPSAHLADVMSKTIATATPDQLLEEVDHFFANISGMPVIDKEHKCVGVLSKKDRAKASGGLKTSVKEVMSSPAITLSAEKTVSDAAVLMLKNKIHRIPIVNDSHQVVGMVTRTDIFNALEGTEGAR